MVVISYTFGLTARSQNSTPSLVQKIFSAHTQLPSEDGAPTAICVIGDPHD